MKTGCINQLLEQLRDLSKNDQICILSGQVTLLNYKINRLYEELKQNFKTEEQRLLLDIIFSKYNLIDSEKEPYNE
jgi:hypothetical protein